MSELKDLAKYKRSVKGLRLRFAPLSIENTNKWLKDINSNIPAVILEEKYNGAETYTALKGLNLIYRLRENKYGGPIVVLSIFNQDNFS